MSFNTKYDFNGYEIKKIRYGSPDDIARDIADERVMEERLQSTNNTDKGEQSTIFNSSGGADLTKIAKD